MEAQSDLSYALELLKRLNSMVSGVDNQQPVTESVSGFEPWWFIQERLFWQILVPYARHRELFRKLLLGEPTTSSEIHKEIAEVLNILGPKLRLDGASRKRSERNAPVSVLYTAIKVVGWIGLTLFSLASLLAFRILRRDTLLYSIDRVSPGLDHDFRISPIYRELQLRGYRYAEYVHVTGLTSALENIWRRGHMVAIYEALTIPITWLLVFENNPRDVPSSAFPTIAATE